MAYPGGAKPLRQCTEEELVERLNKITQDLDKRKATLSARYNLLHDKHMVESELKRRRNG